MLRRLDSLLRALSPRQAAACAFVATFVTVIGGLALALYFRHKNKFAAINTLLGI